MAQVGKNGKDGSFYRAAFFKYCPGHQSCCLNIILQSFDNGACLSRLELFNVCKVSLIPLKDIKIQHFGGMIFPRTQQKV